jgi:transglutaminase-like putative cysteine protease
VRKILAALGLLAGAAAAQAAPSPSPAPLEITKEHVDTEVSADGSYVETREESYRILSAQGLQFLHERQLFYTEGYETLDVRAAYTLKADGKRIDIPKESYLSGFGQTSRPGFQDTHIISLFYPNAEIGDQVVLVTVHRQLKPWFAGHYDARADISDLVVSHDVRYSVTAPASLNLKIDAVGVEGGVKQTGTKTLWVWTFHNDAATTHESDAVSESDYSPHIRLTSFADYADVARAYRERSQDRTNPTPEIIALADDLTRGVTDKRAQAKVLYDWVSSHIAYVEIVLGAGGFTPHEAKDVLSNRFGDCKDHVALLEALLAAKGIDSTAALIHVGSASYKLPDAASPHAFDHVITYLPAFDLYADSTAQIAPFGVLPYNDAGKPVLRVATGELAKTPAPSSKTSSVSVTANVEFNSDGSARGDSRISGTGPYGITLRAFAQAVPAGKESEFFRVMLGPGADGTLDRGNPRSLEEPYAYSATYHVPDVLSLPGPGSLPAHLSLKPFIFTGMVAGSLPPTRNSDYMCLSLAADENTRIVLPAGLQLISVPGTQSFDAEDVHLRVAYSRPDARSLVESFSLRIDHPNATCTADYYARVRGALAKMTNALRQEVIYKLAGTHAR